MKTNIFSGLLYAIFVLLLPLAALGTTITVNTTAHETGTGVACSLFEAITAANNNAAFGGCPAGAAAPVVDIIAFNIPASGVQTITVSGGIPLPNIIDPVFIDGTTQTGAACTQGGLLIVINGTPSGSNNGFSFFGGSSGSTIKGLVIRSFHGAGIRAENSNNDTFICNYIGVDVTGTLARPNIGQGIQILDGSGSTIGGVTAADRNIISGNSFSGIGITQDTVPTSGNKVLGNYIGTNAAGTAAIGNQANGIDMAGADNTSIGSSVSGSGNLISGNVRVGISLAGTMSVSQLNSVVRGNYIGVNVAGDAPVPNGEGGIQAQDAIGIQITGNILSGNTGDGVRVRNTSMLAIDQNYIGLNASANAAFGNIKGIVFISSSGTITGNTVVGSGQDGININGTSNATIQSNSIGRAGSFNLPNGTAGISINDSTNALIGGPGVGEGNIVANSGEIGINVITFSGFTTRISQNSIFNNTNLGIDILPTGPDTNDPGDTDSGSNNRQNYPVIQNAMAGGSTRAIGTYNSTPSRQFRLEFFSSPAAHSTGYGEGQTYLGFTNVTTDGSGNASFDVILPVASTSGHVMSSTATDLTTNATSEFSLAKTLVAPTAAQVALGGRILDANGRGIGKAEIFLTDQQGTVRRALSNPFGYYSYDSVEAGRTYLIGASAKGYFFVQRVITVGDELTNIDLVGIPQ